MDSGQAEGQFLVTYVLRDPQSQVLTLPGSVGLAETPSLHLGETTTPPIEAEYGTA